MESKRLLDSVHFSKLHFNVQAPTVRFKRHSKCRKERFRKPQKNESKILNKIPEADVWPGWLFCSSALFWCTPQRCACPRGRRPQTKGRPIGRCLGWSRRPLPGWLSASDHLISSDHALRSTHTSNICIDILYICHLWCCIMTGFTALSSVNKPLSGRRMAEEQDLALDCRRV